MSNDTPITRVGKARSSRGKRPSAAVVAQDVVHVRDTVHGEGAVKGERKGNPAVAYANKPISTHVEPSMCNNQLSQSAPVANVSNTVVVAGSPVFHDVDINTITDERDLDTLDVAELQQYARIGNLPKLRARAAEMLSVYERAKAVTRAANVLSPVGRTVRQTLFLEAFTGNITAACRAAGITPNTFYQWVDSDAVFVNEFANAKAAVVDRLVDEAMRRAVDGVEKPVGFHKGAPSAYVREYSDTLLMFLLRGLKPDTFDRDVRSAALTDASLSRAQTGNAIPFERISHAGQLEILAILERELGADTVLPGGTIKQLMDSVTTPVPVNVSPPAVDE